MISLRHTYLICCGLFLSWWLAAPYWNWLDLATFKLLNGTLRDRSLWALFWAYMNSDLIDRLMELLVVTATYLGLRDLRKEEKRNYLLELIVYYLSFTVTSLLLKSVLHSGLGWHRLSPTYLVEGAYRLQGLIPYKLKDASRSSFPADHALFLMLVFQYAYRRYRAPFQLALLMITLLFSLPRLFSGGHWLTDLLFGALLPSWLFAKLLLDKQRLLRWIERHRHF